MVGLTFELWNDKCHESISYILFELSVGKYGEFNRVGLLPSLLRTEELERFLDRMLQNNVNNKTLAIAKKSKNIY